jgi:hypothetical protein
MTGTVFFTTMFRPPPWTTRLRPKPIPGIKRQAREPCKCVDVCNACNFTVWVTMHVIILLTNKIGKLYCLEYTEIPKVFFMPQYVRWRQQTASFITTAQITVDLYHSYSKGIANVTMVYKVIVATMGTKANVDSQQWHRVTSEQCVPAIDSVPTFATICSNNDLNYHCCNNVF